VIPYVALERLAQHWENSLAHSLLPFFAGTAGAGLHDRIAGGGARRHWGRECRGARLRRDPLSLLEADGKTPEKHLMYQWR
jgi:hypothetical protein